MSKYKWEILNPDTRKLEKIGFLRPVAAVLANRGLEWSNHAEAREFIDAPVTALNNPLTLKGCREASDILYRSITRGIPITVYGDYDADGITGTALGVEVLTKLGGEVDYYINDRFSQGYGLDSTAIDEIAAMGIPRLLLTVDNGITSVDVVKEARAKGITVIITDHHEPGQYLPPADVVVNPKQKDCPYPFKELSGCGVLFKLLHYLCDTAGRPRAALKGLDLVALGTVADVMPIIGENRILVKNGLKLINWPKLRPGFAAMKRLNKIDEVNAHRTLGYIFGPLINAQGRIEGEAGQVVKLLLEHNVDEAVKIAQRLSEVNQERMSLTEKQVRLAESVGDLKQKALTIFHEELHEGIIGLIASRLKEKYLRPAFIFTRDASGLLKGSARSVPSFPLKEVLDRCAELLEQYGGHVMAAGMTLKEERWHEFSQKIINLADEMLTEEHLIPKLTIDTFIGVKELTLDLFSQIECLEPWGNGFLPPRFLLEDFEVDHVYYMGNNKQHVKLLGKGTGIIWNGAEDYRKAGEPSRLSLVGFPTLNHYNGQREIQFHCNGDEVFD